jgi:hypothetical protein
MLWVYLDESGVHDKTTGKEAALVLGGCLANYADWLRFERAWQRALKDEKIDWFHMVDFESPDSDVSYNRHHWSEEKHRAFLARLLNIIHDHVKSIVGAGCFVSDPDAPLSDSYLANVTGALRSTITEAKFWAFPEEKVSVVFAAHPKVSGQRIGQYFDAVNAAIPGRLEDFSIGNPKSNPPLQAADLAAYELGRFFPRWDWWNARYPLRRLYGRHRVEMWSVRRSAG